MQEILTYIIITLSISYTIYSFFKILLNENPYNHHCSKNCASDSCGNLKRIKNKVIL